MALSRDLKQFLQLLVEHEVEYLLVGAHAVAIHGYVRHTDDIDFWLRREASNAERACAAIAAFGFAQLGLRPQDLLDPDTVVQLGYAPNRIDLLTFLTGLDFEECFERRFLTKYEGTPVNVIALNDLLQNKQLTGRRKDAIDVEEFERAMQRGWKPGTNQEIKNAED